MLNPVNNGSYLIFLVIKLDLTKPGTYSAATGSSSGKLRVCTRFGWIQIRQKPGMDPFQPDPLPGSGSKDRNPDPFRLYHAHQ